MKWLYTILIVASSLLPSFSKASTPEIDSLIQVTEKMPDDSVKMANLYRIALKLRRISPDSSNDFAFQSLRVAQDISQPIYIAKANLQIAVNEKNMGHLSTAEPYYKEALRLHEEINDTMGVGLCLNGLGILYKKRGDFSKSMDYYVKASELYEQMPLERAARNLAVVYNNLGNLVKNHEDYRLSLIYHRKSLDIRLKMGVSGEAMHSYQNMANTFTLMGQLDSALMYYNKSLKLHRDSEDKIALANLLISIGDFYVKLEQLDQAKAHILEAVDIFKAIQDQSGVASAYSSLANYYNVAGKPDLGSNYGVMAMKLARKTSDLLIQREISKTLMASYELIGDYENAFKYQKQLMIVEDSIFNKEKMNAIMEAESKFEVAVHKENLELETKAREEERLRAEAELKAKDEHAKAQEEKAKAQEEREKANKWILAALLIGLIASAIALFFFFRSNLQKKRANQQLERQQQEILNKNSSLEKANSQIQRISDEISEKNKDITDSINYAKKIQRNALPDPQNLQTIFKESFVIYKPKDIIGGDFYWYHQVGDYAIIAVADCTGHGVPGALMSMVGLNHLHQIVTDKNISSPSEALALLDKGIYQALSVTEFSETKDGMDIALCAINKKTRELEFSGAARPLVMIHNDEIVSFRGNRHSIGGHLIHDKAFTHETFQLNDGDQIYLFSDGYADQFGGEKGKKFKNKALRKLLFENRHLPMQEQSDILYKAFQSWKGDLEQVDDICLLGFTV